MGNSNIKRKKGGWDKEVKQEQIYLTKLETNFTLKNKDKYKVDKVKWQFLQSLDSYLYVLPALLTHNNTLYQ